MSTQQLIRATRTRPIIDERIAQEEEEWVQVFPQTFSTKRESLEFMQKLMGLGISSILYLRSVFPNSAFGNRKLGDVPLKVLHGMNDPTRRAIGFMKGCFDALSKTYLHEAELAIYLDQNDTETVVETYSFCFEYSVSGDPRMTLTSGGSSSGWLNKLEYKGERHVKKQTREVLRKLTLLLSNMDALPDEVFITMKLTYYEERTPANYEPPGFISASCDKFKFPVGKSPTTLTIGRVGTKHHGCKLKMKSIYLTDDDEGEEAEAEEADRSTDRTVEDNRKLIQKKPEVVRNLFQPRTVADAGLSPSQSPSVTVPANDNAPDWKPESSNLSRPESSGGESIETQLRALGLFMKHEPI